MNRIHRPPKGNGIPHLFAKATILYCILFVSVASVYCMAVTARTGVDTTGLLAIIVGFFGGELLLLLLKTVFQRKKEGTDDGCI